MWNPAKSSIVMACKREKIKSYCVPMQAEYKSVLWQSRPQIMASFQVGLQNEIMMVVFEKHWKHV